MAGGDDIFFFFLSSKNWVFFSLDACFSRGTFIE